MALLWSEKNGSNQCHIWEDECRGRTLKADAFKALGWGEVKLSGQEFKNRWIFAKSWPALKKADKLG